MPRIRTIKPEFWRSPDTAKASPLARLLYIAMWNWADDYGVGEWTPRELLGFAFPHDEDLTAAEFQRLCKEVADSYGTAFYTVRGRRFYCVQTWDDHQKTERRALDKNPKPSDPEAVPDQAIHGAAETRGNSAVNVGTSSPGKGTGEKEQGKGTGEQGKAARSRDTRIPEDFTVTPEMRDWAAEKTPAVDVDHATEKFIDHWRSKAGKDALKTDWVATWRNWLRSDQERAPTTPGSPKQTNAQRNLAVVQHFQALESA